MGFLDNLGLNKNKSTDDDDSEQINVVLSQSINFIGGQALVNAKALFH